MKSKRLIRDKQQAEAYDNDKLITKKIGVNILVTLFETSKNCFKRLKDFKHAIFHEIDQHKLLEPCQKFIKQIFSDETLNLPAVIPQARKHTVVEYQELLQKGPSLKQFITSFTGGSLGIRK